MHPRARRWESPDEESVFQDFVMARAQLEVIEEGDVAWAPYAGDGYVAVAAMERAMSRFRHVFYTLDTWEVYMGERFFRQHSGEFRIPHHPPVRTFDLLSSTAPVAVEPVPGVQLAGEVVPFSTYTAWFIPLSIGMLTGLDHLTGGRLLGGRVYEHWMAGVRGGLVSRTLLEESETAREVLRVRLEAVEVERDGLRVSLEESRKREADLEAELRAARETFTTPREQSQRQDDPWPTESYLREVLAGEGATPSEATVDAAGVGISGATPGVRASTDTILPEDVDRAEITPEGPVADIPEEATVRDVADSAIPPSQ